MGFPGGTVVKNPPTNAGDTGSIPRLGRCPRVGNGNPLQYFYLGNPMNRGAWQATVQQNTHTHTHTHTGGIKSPLSALPTISAGP